LTLHARVHEADGSERQMLFEALDDLQPGQDVLLLDRSYPDNWMAAPLTQRKLDFCMRVDATGWKVVKNFMRSNQSKAWITLDPPKRRDAEDYQLQRIPTRVRLICDVAPAGSKRILMTSLLDPKQYPATGFGALYHRRWRVEDAFKRIKHRLRLEAVSGLNHLALKQDFAAKVVANNLHTLLVAAQAPENIQEADADWRPNQK
jgi:IS4 transposase